MCIFEMIITFIAISDDGNGMNFIDATNMFIAYNEKDRYGEIGMAVYNLYLITN